MSERPSSHVLLERWNLAWWWAAMYFGALGFGWVRDGWRDYLAICLDLLSAVVAVIRRISSW